MDNGVYVTLSYQAALRRQADIIANNIANSSTTAFKAEKPLFEEFLIESTNGKKVSFMRDFGTIRNLTEGNFVTTSNQFDMAIHGDGYFVIETPQGPRYTRNGNFTLDTEGQIVTTRGYPVLDESGAPIVVSAASGSISVSRDGTVSPERGSSAKLQLVTFKDQQRLKKHADGLYSTQEDPQPPGPEIQVLQSKLESSNVEPIIEMTNLIKVHRMYESSQKTTQSDHDQQRKMIDSLTSFSA
jgi:flagellar basal-body rod protein FlgF